MTTRKIGEKLDNLENLIRNLRAKDQNSKNLKVTVLQIGNIILKLATAIAGLIKLIHLLS